MTESKLNSIDRAFRDKRDVELLLELAEESCIYDGDHYARYVAIRDRRAAEDAGEAKV